MRTLLDEPEGLEPEPESYPEFGWTRAQVLAGIERFGEVARSIDPPLPDDRDVPGFVRPAHAHEDIPLHAHPRGGRPHRHSTG